MRPAIAIPRSIRRSPLMQRGGFDVFADLLDSRYVEALQAEAIAAYEDSTLTDVKVSIDAEERGGSPARRFASGQGGPLQHAFYAAPWLSEFLRDLAGVAVHPTGDQATFSYYVSPGDFIDVHRDIETCDLAVITCLLDSAPERTSGSLCVYPDRVKEPVRAIRASRGDTFERVHLAPGQTIVLLGGIVPHRLEPVGEGQQRVVSVMCFGAEAGKGREWSRDRASHSASLQFFQTTRRKHERR